MEAEAVDIVKILENKKIFEKKITQLFNDFEAENMCFIELHQIETSATLDGERHFREFEIKIEIDFRSARIHIA
jgi:hypothetical protein